MSEFLKILFNIRSLRAALRELPFEQLEEAKLKFDEVFAERESAEAKSKEASVERDRKLAEFSEMLKNAGIDPSELVGSVGVTKSEGKSKASRAPRPPKFKYVEDGQERTWTGQGRMPKAIAEAVASGRAIEDFLI
ncbi:H-NS family nucleoid-associated regulatory protein [Aeromonas salmonicida]|uniref:H-NS family histone-like protein n=1 Tax=Aeromonas salmonicida TaxID=645 RepID=UPI000BB65513|nr:H-NS family nucleoid-associated regulatory protein [Aeromonas salmonicida]PBO11224.1 transcriptional regulator [Aeromonas salmonicida]